MMEIDGLEGLGNFWLAFFLHSYCSYREKPSHNPFFPSVALPSDVPLLSPSSGGVLTGRLSLPPNICILMGNSQNL